MHDVRPDAAARFAADTSEHVMTVLHDDGLYRHLRFKKPDTSFYWFDLITWPGVLTIRGDMGTFVFARTDDMLGFFRGSAHAGRPNLGYWAEKETTGAPTQGWDEEIAKGSVIEQVMQDYDPEETEDAEKLGALLGALEREVFTDDQFTSVEGAMGLLHSFRWGTGRDAYQFEEVYEIGMTTWTWQYEWCAHAILWGADQYAALTAAPKETTDA